MAASHAARPATVSPSARCANAASSRLPPSYQASPGRRRPRGSARGRPAPRRARPSWYSTKPPYQRVRSAIGPSSPARSVAASSARCAPAAGRRTWPRTRLSSSSARHPEVPGRGVRGRPRRRSRAAAAPSSSRTQAQPKPTAIRSPVSGSSDAGAVQGGVDRRAFGGGDGDLRGLAGTADRARRRRRPPARPSRPWRPPHASAAPASARTVCGEVADAVQQAVARGARSPGDRR